MTSFVSSDYEIKKRFGFTLLRGSKLFYSDSESDQIKDSNLDHIVEEIFFKQSKSVICDTLATQLLLAKQGVNAICVSSIQEIAHHIFGTTHYKELGGFNGVYHLDKIENGTVIGKVKEDPDNVTQIGTTSRLPASDCYNYRKIDLGQQLHPHFKISMLSLKTTVNRMKDIIRLIEERTTL